MIGNKLTNRHSSESGQVLLLLIMVLGTLLIVAMTAIYQSTSQTQISGINQNAQLTLSAAEAGLEKALSGGAEGSFGNLGLTTLSGIDLNNSRVNIEEITQPEFSTTTVDQDEQSTFYLADRTLTTSYGGQFEIYYQSVAGDCVDIALQLTIVYDQGNDGVYEQKQLVSDAGGVISGVDPADNIFNATIPADPPPATIDGQTYQCKTAQLDTGDYANVKLMYVQPLLGSSRIGMYSLSGNFPPQGKTITSTARATNGLTRSAKIFQSYPQIPSELYMTSF